MQPPPAVLKCLHATTFDDIYYYVNRLHAQSQKQYKPIIHFYEMHSVEQSKYYLNTCKLRLQQAISFHISNTRKGSCVAKHVFQI